MVKVASKHFTETFRNRRRKNGSEQNPSLVENWTSKKRNVINLTSKRACWHDDDEQVQAEHTF